MVMTSSTSRSANAERGGSLPEVSVTGNAEAALFDALGQVFHLDPPQALRLSQEAFGSIASFLADVSAGSTSQEHETLALEQIDEMLSELEELKCQLGEFVAGKSIARN